jgi:hypothetical protein
MLSFKTEGGIKIYHDKLKQYMTTIPTENSERNTTYIGDENKHSHERMGIIKTQEKGRQVESIIELVAHTQKSLHTHTHKNPKLQESPHTPQY